MGFLQMNKLVTMSCHIYTLHVTTAVGIRDCGAVSIFLQHAFTEIAEVILYCLFVVVNCILGIC